MMRTTWLIAAALSLTVAPAALADTIQFSVNSSITASVAAADDDVFGTYTNVANVPFFVGHPIFESGASGPAPVSGFSVVLPAGSVFTNAEVSITGTPTPLNPAIGTGHMFPVSAFAGEIDHSIPSVAPTFSNTGTSSAFVELDGVSQTTTFNGDEISVNFGSVFFLLQGSIQSAVLDPGSNWAGFLGGNGQVTIPYTIQWDVTYTPAVPEPSSLVLLGTGAFGLLATFRRRNSQLKI